MPAYLNFTRTIFLTTHHKELAIHQTDISGNRNYTEAAIKFENKNPTISS